MSVGEFIERMKQQGRTLSIKDDWLVIEPTKGLTALELVFLAKKGKELKDKIALVS